MLDFLKTIFRRHIIILIHGLENKPPRELLKTWCVRAINEGLERIGKAGKSFSFELVYWADLFYERPQDPAITDEGDPYFLDDPYVPGEKVNSSAKKKVIQKKALDFLEKQLDDIFFDEKKGIKAEKISEYLVQKLFRDLDVYYHKNCVVPAYAAMNAKNELRKRLADVLKKHRRKKIMLIAHSMGTIIAYDVLSHTAMDVTVDTFITIGSPLGLPLIMKKIFDERGIPFKKGVKTPVPENISKQWLNFSDLSDPVAMNYNLADDYGVNSRGVGPIDFIVENDYVYNKKRNHHKLYGYLRAKEVSEAIGNFIEN